jgi:hypothetical protein
MTASPIFAAFTLLAKRPAVLRCGSSTVVRATYIGRSNSPDRRLGGNVAFRARLEFDRTGSGVATGKLTVRDDRKHVRMTGNVRAVVFNRINVHGIVDGKLSGPRALLLANISLVFASNLTYGNGRLGVDTALNSGVAYRTRKCG